MRPILLRAPDYPLDTDALRASITDRTRVILLNTPHNPTGKVFTRAELAQIAELAIEHDLIVLADEVYQHIVFDDHEHVPIASLPGMRERTITMGSAGKSFSFTGWKVGWSTAPAPLKAALQTAKQFLTFVNAAPMQPAVAAGLRLPDAYFTDFRDTLQDKRDLLATGLQQAGFEVLDTQGAYFLTCDITDYAAANDMANTSIEFCLALPEAKGVVAVPSEVFYQTREAGRSLIRFAFCKKVGVLEGAVERLAN